MPIPHGFDNGTIYCTNVDFRGILPVQDQMTQDGQLLIGSATAPQIRAGFLTSAIGSVSVLNGSGSIDLSVGSDSNLNTYLGTGSGVVGEGVENTAVGANSLNDAVGPACNSNACLGAYTMQNAFGSYSSVALGWSVLRNSTQDFSNVGAGVSALENLNGSNYCNAVGSQSLFNITSGAHNNNALGGNTFLALIGGTGNLGLGHNSGGNYQLNESFNTLISSVGVTGEDSVLRLGDTSNGTVGLNNFNKAYICGINGNTSLTSPLMVVIDNQNQLGTQAIPSGGVVSVTGDTGTTITGAVNLVTGVSSRNCGSTVSFVNGTTTSTLNLSDNSNNTVLGKGSGNLASTGNNNFIAGNNCFTSAGSSSYCTGVGYGVLVAATSVVNATAIGLGALAAAINSQNCTSVGFLSLNASQRDNGNTCVGSYSLSVMNGGTAAINNACLGFESGLLLINGNRNLFLGTAAGSSYTGGNSNICLNSSGVNGESNTLRIGQANSASNYGLTTAYIHGIAGATLSAGSPTPRLMLIDSSNSQIVSPTPVALNTASTTFGSLAVGTALQNTSNYPIVVNVEMVMSAATTAVISVGVASTNTPTAQAVTASFSGAAVRSFNFVVPAKYFAQVTTSGTITVDSITTFVSQVG